MIDICEPEVKVNPGVLERVQLQSLLPGQPSAEVVDGILDSDTVEALKRITIQTDTTIFRLLMSAQTAREFYLLRKEELFEKYVKLSLAGANFVSAMVPRGAVEFQEIVQALFQRNATRIEQSALLTDEMRTEALFSLATLHRAYALLPSVERDLPDVSGQARDRELCGRFTALMFWSQMHLDCLSFAIATGNHPKPEVLRCVIEGSRASLEMYSAIREAVDLRSTDADSPAWPVATILSSDERGSNVVH
jgi:hypothetical protein